MWWGVATLTTVGYGDVYPITALGKILGAFIAIMGVGIFALPAGIIASGFESEIRKNQRRKIEKIIFNFLLFLGLTGCWYHRLSEHFFEFDTPNQIAFGFLFYLQQSLYDLPHCSL